MTLLAIFILVLALLQFSTPDLVGNDGYYHIKMADLMSSGNLKPDFPWLPFTILNPGEFSDHHFLFHVFLIPFTLGDLVQGAKWASVLFASLAFLSIWWLLRGQEVPFAGLWVLGLMAVSGAFLYRMSMPRAQSLSLVILVLGLNFLLRKKYAYLLPLAFVYVWLYDAFPLLVAVVVVYLIAQWLTTRRMDIQALAYVLVGVTFGLLINPYFPDNIIFGTRHMIPKLLGQAEVRVGNEWYPYETTQLLENSPVGLLAFLSGVIALGLNRGRMDTRTAAALLLAIFFGLMLFQARRFVEYFPPFALIFAALAWTPMMVNLVSGPGEISLNLANRRFPYFSLEESITWRSQVMRAVLVLIVLLGTWQVIQQARGQVEDSKPAGLYAGASSWLVENTSRGSKVFQTDWDDFPRLFFHNTWNTYIVGLDPTFMQIKDPVLYDKWVAITRGEVEQPARHIHEDFTSDYVLTDLNHESFISRAGEDPELVEVYRDEQAAVYQVELSDQ